MLLMAPIRASRASDLSSMVALTFHTISRLENKHSFPLTFSIAARQFNSQFARSLSANDGNQLQTAAVGKAKYGSGETLLAVPGKHKDAIVFPDEITRDSY